MKVVTEIFAITLLISLLGCGNDDTSDPDPGVDPRSEIKITFSGSEQTGFIGEALLDSLEITVLDSANTPITGLKLTISGDGEFGVSSNSLSNSVGKLKVKWALGNRYFNIMEASFAGNDKYLEASKSLQIKGIYKETCN